MKEGDFIEIDMTGRVSATGEIFDTTNAEDAKNAGVHDEKREYKPILVIVGAHMTIPGVEAQLTAMKVGEEKEFEVKSALAFGNRDPKLVRIMPLKRFLEKKVNPSPGMFVDIDGMQARIKSVSGGRVRVDFNHPLAGRDLKYRLKVVRQITDTKEKAESLLKYYNIKAEVSLEADALAIKAEKKIEQPQVREIIEKTINKWIPEAKKVTIS
jgi:FKBP-type peptidyl-prolyl cis-trans isomerase 2